MEGNCDGFFYWFNSRKKNKLQWDRIEIKLFCMCGHYSTVEDVINVRILRHVLCFWHWSYSLSLFHNKCSSLSIFVAKLKHLSEKTNWWIRNTTYELREKKILSFNGWRGERKKTKKGKKKISVGGSLLPTI